MRIRLGILDQDEMYKMRLINYFSANYADKVEIFSFSDQAKLEKYLADNPLDVLLSDENSIEDSTELQEQVAFAYWAESANVEIRNVRTVCKYQKAELIYKEILGLYAESASSSNTFHLGNGSKCAVVTFMGAAGGVGTSTMAAACAFRAARFGKKVLFLDLTQLGDTNEFFEGEGAATLSEALYAIKSNHSNLFLKLESMVRRDLSGVNFYESCRVALDTRDATEENISMLIRCLAESESYELIVIDADSLMTDKQKSIMAASNCVVLISDGWDISNKKLKKLVQAYRLDPTLNRKEVGKLAVMYNRFHTGAKMADGLDNLTVLGGINVYKNATPKQIAREVATKDLMDCLIPQTED